MVVYVTGVLNNGLGHYYDALDGARRAYEHDDLGFYGWALPELVEAAARSADPGAATEALQQLEDRTSAAGTEWALGILARGRFSAKARPRKPTIGKQSSSWNGAGSPFIWGEPIFCTASG